MWTPLDYFRNEAGEEPVEASFQIEDTLRQNLEEYRDPDEEWSYGVLHDPDISGIVPGESGTAFIYENGQQILEEQYSDAVEYLGERMDLDAVDHVGIIDPFDTGSAPTSIIMMQELDETEVIEDSSGNTVELGALLDTQVYFGERVDGVQIFSRYKEPGEGFEFEIGNL
ncbi:MAG: hypothetical protein ABEK10_03290 [Candidatus Nanosalina sp.]